LDDGTVTSYASVFTEAADEIALTRTILANAVELNKTKADEIERLRAAVLLAAEALKVARPGMEWARDTGSRDDREVASWALSRIDAAIHSLKQEGG
jgi:hypothetical protein